MKKLIFSLSLFLIFLFHFIHPIHSISGYYLTKNSGLDGEYSTTKTDIIHTFNDWEIEWHFWKRATPHLSNVGAATFSGGKFNIETSLPGQPAGDVLYASLKQYEKGFNWNDVPDYWKWENFRVGDHPYAEVRMSGAQISHNKFWWWINGIVDLIFIVPSTYKGVTSNRIVLVDLYFYQAFPYLYNSIEDHEGNGITIYKEQLGFQNGQQLSDILKTAMNDAKGFGFNFNWEDAELVEVTWGIETCNGFPWYEGYGQLQVKGSVDFFGVVECGINGYSCSSDAPCCYGYSCAPTGGRERICKVPMSVGCPILKVWDGKEFNEIEKLDIHAPEGSDKVYPIGVNMKPYEEGKYKIILKEASYIWLEWSHIDNVKLIDENGKECRLVSAVHSKKGDVLKELENSDDIRVDTKPGEEVELIFDKCSGENFTFSIEGYNPVNRWMKMGLSYTNIIVIVVVAIILVIIFGAFKYFANKNRE